MDEISVCDSTRVSELKDGQIRTYDIHPEQFFGDPAEPEDLIGGDPEENARITRLILEGEKGARRNVVVINSAAALMAAGKAEDLRQGIKIAEEAIDTGKAGEKLDELVRYTRENG